MKAKIQLCLRIILVILLVIPAGCGGSKANNTANDDTDYIVEGGDSSPEKDDENEDSFPPEVDTIDGLESASGFIIPNELLVLYTGESDWPVVGIDNDGNMLAALTENSNSGDVGFVGATLIPSSGGDDITVLGGEDGLPMYAFIDNIIFMYSNYTEKTVDVTIVDPDKKRFVVTVDREDNTSTTRRGIRSSAATVFDDETLDLMKAGLMIGAAIGFTIAALYLSPVALSATIVGTTVSWESAAIVSIISLLTVGAVNEYIQENRRELSPFQIETLEMITNVSQFVYLGDLGAWLDIVNSYLITAVRAAKDLLGVLANIANNLWSSGDPHLCTIDGLHYDFQAVGEFVYLESTIDPMEMTVQVRQEPYRNSKYVAVNSAVAMSVAGDHVEIYGDSTEYQTPIFINGGPITLSPEAETFNLPSGGQLNIDQNRYTAIWPDYSQIQVTKRSSYLDITGYLPERRKNTLQGLAGNFDDELTNDLMTRDGSLTIDIDMDIEKDKLYNEFGNSWRIAPDESLFTYLEGEDTSTFTNLNFPYEIVTVEDLSVSQYLLAEQICREAGITDLVLLEDCILDVGFTDDPIFAEGKENLKQPNLSLEVTNDWILYWDAQQAEDSEVITITPDLGWKTGMALRESSLNLNSDFEKSFEVYMGDDDNGADGIIFLLLSEAPSPDTSIDGGGFLGFDSACNGKPCVGIEIDTYRNNSDPAEDHIALIRNGSVNHSSPQNENFPIVPLTSNIEDDTAHSITIEWKQKTKTLSVKFDGSTIITQENFDLPNILGTSAANYGFSGATGRATNEQFIIPSLGF